MESEDVQPEETVKASIEANLDENSEPSLDSAADGSDVQQDPQAVADNENAITPERVAALEFKEVFDAKIDALRALEKNIFYSLLSNETVDQYGPLYKEGAQ